MQLSDIEWGDVLSDADGIVVAEGVVDGTHCIVKRFADEGDRREIANYALLGRLGVPTLEVLGSGEDWIALEDIDDSEWRLGTAADLADADVAWALASWYARLHSAGAGAPELAGLFRQTDLVTAESLELVGRRWPELASGVAWAQNRLPELRATLAACRPTLTYNDFFWTNLAVHRFGGAALMFDYNLLGAGYAYADVRNVLTSLTPDAGDAFLDTYSTLLPLDPAEAGLDAELAPLVAVVLAARLVERPRWAEPSLAWLASRG